MVAAEHPLGARVGAAILERGGNAVDAAVATAFAMTVVEPFMSTIAGSGTMLVHFARKGETVALDFNGCAPMRAHESMFRVTGWGLARTLRLAERARTARTSAAGSRRPCRDRSRGCRWHSSDTAPWSLRDAIQPAIELAREGFVADWYQALTTARQLEELAAFRRGRRASTCETADRSTGPRPAWKKAIARPIPISRGASS